MVQASTCHELRAPFGFSGIEEKGGVVGHFESYAELGEDKELLGLEQVGETGQRSLRGGLPSGCYATHARLSRPVHANKPA